MTTPAANTVSSKAAACMSAVQSVLGSRLRAGRLHLIGQHFSFPLANPDTKGLSRSFVDSGRIGGILEEGGRKLLLEYRTTSDSLDGDSDYWQRLAVDTSVSRQILGALDLGEDVSSVLYIVFRRTQAHPKQLPVLDAEGLKIVQDVHGQRVLNANGKPRQSPDAGQGFYLKTVEETLDQFATRMACDAVADPHSLVAVREVAKLDTNLLEYVSDTWAAGQQILWYRKAGFPRNPDACKAYGTCPYLPICSGRATVDGVQFQAAFQRDPGQISHLTSQSLRALRKCPRFYSLSEEQGVRRAGDEDERLAFGMEIQLRMRAWLNSLTVEQPQLNTAT